CRRKLHLRAVVDHKCKLWCARLVDAVNSAGIGFANVFPLLCGLVLPNYNPPNNHSSPRVSEETVDSSLDFLVTSSEFWGSKHRPCPDLDIAITQSVDGSFAIRLGADGRRRRHDAPQYSVHGRAVYAR